MSEPFSPSDVRSAFVLDADLAYFNHAGFGAMSRYVRDERLWWLAKAEENPSRFFEQSLPQALDEVRKRLARYLGASNESLTLATNVTIALNVVARSLLGRLGDGDEVLISDLEYGAQVELWSWVCRRSGAHLRFAPLSTSSPDTRAEAVLSRVNSRTRIVVLSHVTSLTSLQVPVEVIFGALTGSGIVRVVDGAHGPGQLPLRLSGLECEVYAGALHKWFCSPHGSAFLHVSPEFSSFLEPLVITWNGADALRPLYSRATIMGTADYSPLLAVPSAIELHRSLLLGSRRAASRRLQQCVTSLNAIGYESLHPSNPELLMATLRLPRWVPIEALRAEFQKSDVVALVTDEWPAGPILRISMAWYCTDQDVDRLLAAASKAASSRTTK